MLEIMRSAIQDRKEKAALQLHYLDFIIHHGYHKEKTYNFITCWFSFVCQVKDYK